MSPTKVLRRFDQLLATSLLKIKTESPALITFLFHSLFADAEEARLNLIDPQQHTTASDLDFLIEHFCSLGYRFVTPYEIHTGLPADGKYALLTFDDGYANNIRALPVLKKHQCPAIFFVCPGHVFSGNCFWWDIVYREGMKNGIGTFAIAQSQKQLKQTDPTTLLTRLENQFGVEALKPRGDVDRPMTVDELKLFASEPWVHIGNHTADHVILTRCGDDTVRKQVRSAQQQLRDMLGAAPTTIAYPNGDYSDRVIEICREEGLSMGITVEPKRNGSKLDKNSSMRLGRFTPTGGEKLNAECDTFRVDFSLYNSLKRGYRKLRSIHQ